MVFYVENENCLKVRITKPQSRKNLRQLATQIRAKLGIDSKQLYVDILFCLEILIPKIDSSFQYKILHILPPLPVRSSVGRPFYRLPIQYPAGLLCQGQR